MSTEDMTGQPRSDKERSSKPQWTVVSNVVSPEDSTWIGTCWEFFDGEEQAKHCYDRQIQSGNSPTKRPYYEKTDRDHLGAVHRMRDERKETQANENDSHLPRDL